MKRDPALATPLHELLLGALALPIDGDGDGNAADAAALPAAAEADWLAARAAWAGADPPNALRDWLRDPPAAAQRLLALSAHLELALIEVAALALAAAVETDTMAGRVLAWLQAPVAGVRPTIGLLLRVGERFGLGTPGALLASLVDGAARRCGVLLLEDASRTLPEVGLQAPVPIVLALHQPAAAASAPAGWPGASFDAGGPVALAASVQAEAVRQARALPANGVLAVRSGHPREARAACALLAEARGMRAVFVDTLPAEGFGAWAWLEGALPVLCIELAPGETRALQRPPGGSGALLVATGPDGGFTQGGDPLPQWRVALPAAAERAALWRAHTADAELARTLGAAHRCGAFGIHRIGVAAQHEAGLDDARSISRDHVARAVRGGAGGALGQLAELLPEPIGDDALITSAALRDELQALRLRCEAREQLTDGLGPSARARYRPGVRALFVGPSGTGKTLAVGWLASALGLPLYRIDLAAVSSKYIGETEKNLAQLFARAEHADGVLLFDEADALFGKRTELKDSNDRFANAQTNYLLQRIESFEGIAVLTSNSRARFDSAFTRRLDAIVEFPLPTPIERRALWAAHLGSRHALAPAELNCLATLCELAGGHIRNVVLAAAAQATAAHGVIGYDAVAAAAAAEYRKLGRQPPAGLRAGAAR